MNQVAVILEADQLAVVQRARAAKAEVDRVDLRARCRQRLGAEGVNLLHSAGGVAWQTVFHFHIHVIPRYAGDPLVLPWVPAPGEAAEIAAAAAAMAAD